MNRISEIAVRYNLTREQAQEVYMETITWTDVNWSEDSARKINAAIKQGYEVWKAGGSAAYFAARSNA